MTETYLHLSPPNTCALIYSDTKITYVATDYTTKIWPFDGYTDFEQFVLPEDAASRVLELDSNFDTSCILGPLTITPVNVSDSQQEVISGQDLTLYSEYECPNSTLTYQWTDAYGKPFPGETSSSFTFSDITQEEAGVYACQVTSRNNKNQTGNNQSVFYVTVVPAFEGSGTIRE